MLRLLPIGIVPPAARELAHARHRSGTKQVQRGRWWRSRRARACHERAVEIGRLESQADRHPRRGAVGGCSTRSATPIAIIKWKEILDMLEDATDRCKDVANAIEGIVVKHG